jgi:hypothetical protein
MTLAIYNRVCNNDACKRPFTTSDARKVSCSPNCRVSAWRQQFTRKHGVHPETLAYRIKVATLPEVCELECEWCGDPFQRNPQHAGVSKWCSVSCRNAAYYARKQARLSKGSTAK